MRGTSKYLRFLWFICLFGSIAAFVVTFALTEQTPQETTALSRSVEQIMVNSTESEKEDFAPTLDAKASDDGAESMVSLMLSVANVRRWAHVSEFFVQGMFLFGVALLWPGENKHHRCGRGAYVRVGIALSVCMVCSLFDQVHKMFVPGREFDPLDFPFDALGYMTALLLVFSMRSISRLLAKMGVGFSAIRRKMATHHKY